MDTMDVNAQVLEKTFNQEEVPVIVLKEFEINAYVKSRHVDKNIQTPEIGESLYFQIEPNNPANKYAVCMQKFGTVVGHLKKVVDLQKLVDFQKQYFFPERYPYSKAKTKS